jgi:hypothetical protein
VALYTRATPLYHNEREKKNHRVLDRALFRLHTIKWVEKKKKGGLFIPSSFLRSCSVSHRPDRILFYYSVLFNRNFFGLFPSRNASVVTLLLLGITWALCSQRHAFIFYALAISQAHSLYPLSFTRNSKYGFSGVGQVRCRSRRGVRGTCAQLPSTHTLTFVLFTLRSALLSEIADDQSSRLAKPSPCPLLTDWRIYSTLFFHLYAGVRS